MQDLPGYLYKLTFPSGKEYIGITTRTVKKRFAAHVSAARAGNTSCAVHRAISFYGADSVQIETLLSARFEFLKEMEQRAIVRFNTLAPHGYNITRGGDSISDQMRSLETRIKIGNASRGRSMSAEARAKISLAQTGRRQSDESREKIRLANLGKKHSQETLEKMSASLKGKRLSEDHKAILSAYHTGRPKSLESIQKRKDTIARKKTALTEGFSKALYPSQRDAGAGEASPKT